MIELLLVAAILTTLAAIAAPRYAESLTRYRVEAAANRIAADLARARTTAQAQSSTVTLRFHAGGYEIDGVPGLDGASGYRVDLRQSPYHITAISLEPDDVDYFAIDGHGTFSRGGEVVVQVGGVLRRVVIDGQSGKTRIER